MPDAKTEQLKKRIEELESKVAVLDANREAKYESVKKKFAQVMVTS